MAVLALILFRNYEVLNPLFIFGSIAKVRSDYIAVYLFLFLAEIASKFAQLLTAGTALVAFGAFAPYIMEFVFIFISIYFMLVQMRVLGDMFYFNQKRLAWFGKRPETTVPAAPA